MWKRFNFYEGVIALFFLFNLLLTILNKEYGYFIPKHITDYSFWLSLGFYLGFQLCKFEMKRQLQKQ